LNRITWKVFIPLQVGLSEKPLCILVSLFGGKPKPLGAFGHISVGQQVPRAQEELSVAVALRGGQVEQFDCPIRIFCNAMPGPVHLAQKALSIRIALIGQWRNFLERLSVVLVLKSPFGRLEVCRGAKHRAKHSYKSTHRELL